MTRSTSVGLLEGVVTFDGSIHGLRAEKRLKAAGLSCRLVPTPRELSSTCALALAFGRPDLAAVADGLQAGGLRFEAIYVYPVGGGNPVRWRR